MKTLANIIITLVLLSSVTLFAFTRRDAGLPNKNAKTSGVVVNKTIVYHTFNLNQPHETYN